MSPLELRMVIRSYLAGINTSDASTNFGLVIALRNLIKELNKEMGV